MDSAVKDEEIRGKVIEKIIAQMDYKDQLKYRRICSAFNSKICEQTSKNRLILLNDISAVTSYMSVMKGCTELIRNELAFSLDISHPIVQTLFDDLGSKIKLLYIYDPLCTPELLRELLSAKVTNIRFFSMYLNVEKFEGKSLFSLDENNKQIQKFQLPNLEGLCLDSGQNEGNLSLFTLDMLESSSSKLENLLLNFKTRIPLTEIIERIKSPLENLFVGWMLEQEDVTELIKTQWPLEQLRLQLTEAHTQAFSAVALYAILEQFSKTLQVFSNYSLTIRTLVDVQNTTYNLVTVPTMNALVSLQLENIRVPEPGILSNFPNLQDLRIRPFQLEDAFKIISPKDTTAKYLSLRDLEIQVLSESFDEINLEEQGCLIVNSISKTMPNIQKLVMPGTDKMLAIISKTMSNVQELRLDGYFTDAGIIGTDLEDNVGLSSSIGNLKQLKILHLGNKMGKHGLTAVSIELGLLACKNLEKVYLFGDDKLVQHFYSAKKSKDLKSYSNDENDLSGVNIGNLTI